MRVLIVEDHLPSAKVLELMLSREGVQVHHTASGREAVELCQHYCFDILLLDLGLPDLGGQDVMRALRRAANKTPVLVLTSDETSETMITAFAQGADDYLTKPYRKEEVMARVRAIVRRSNGHGAAKITTGKVILNLDAKTVHVDGELVPLTSKEYQLYELLALRKGATITKEMVLDHLYGGMDEPESKIIDVFMCKLRRKIADLNGGDHYIETIWGRGYLLRDPESFGLGRSASKAA